GLAPSLNHSAGKQCVNTSYDETEDNRHVKGNQQYNRDNRCNQGDAGSIVPSAVFLCHRCGSCPAVYFFLSGKYSYQDNHYCHLNEQCVDTPGYVLVIRIKRLSASEQAEGGEIVVENRGE